MTAASVVVDCFSNGWTFSLTFSLMVIFMTISVLLKLGCQVFQHDSARGDSRHWVRENVWRGESSASRVVDRGSGPGGLGVGENGGVEIG